MPSGLTVSPVGVGVGDGVELEGGVELKTEDEEAEQVPKDV